MAANSESSHDPASGGLKSLIIAVLGVALLGLGGGYGAATLLLVPEAATPAPAPADEKPAEKPAEAHDEAAKPSEGETSSETAEAESAPAELVVVPLQTITTNLKEPSTVWVRFEGSLLVRKREEAAPPDLALRISQHVLAYLRTLKLTDFEGTHGLYAVHQDLNEIAASLSDGLASEVLISSLVLE